MPNINLLLNEIPFGIPYRVTNGEVSVVLVRSDGQIRAFEDVCPHALWPLSSGEIDEGVLVCPGHGWEFSIETGQCRHAATYCLRAVPLTIEGDKVVLDCSDLSAERRHQPPQKIAVQPTA
jgi:toluene monooxygenase system ferredoxin subunit